VPTVLFKQQTMSNYRRLYIEGATYFFTLVTHERKPILCEEASITRLKQSFEYVKEKHPFTMLALVILPDHLHCIWQLPDSDHDFSKRWSLFKHYYSSGFPEVSSTQKREKMIWQRRFWEHCIQDEYDFENHMNYIYYNPVKHGYVEKVSDWRYSTFKKSVALGLYPANWGNSVDIAKVINLDLE
jgi:putative transposase